MSVVRIDPPIEDGDRRWISISVHVHGRGPALSSASYQYRTKSGEWSLNGRRAYSGEVDEIDPVIAARLLRLGIEREIASCTTTIARAIDERNGWTEALNGLTS